MYNERNEQLELGFDRNPVTRPVQRRRRRDTTGRLVV